MSDVKIEQERTLSRPEIARFLAALAEGLGSDDGEVTVELGDTTLELTVADRLRCELEVEVDGDEIELEIELKWAVPGRATTAPHQEGSDEARSEEDRAPAAEGSAAAGTPGPRKAPESRARQEKRRPSPA
ncbi:amphi-Trp domain-containing protein [Geodermatophilus sp. SYSU D00710]